MKKAKYLIIILIVLVILLATSSVATFMFKKKYLSLTKYLEQQILWQYVDIDKKIFKDSLPFGISTRFFWSAELKDILRNDIEELYHIFSQKQGPEAFEEEYGLETFLQFIKTFLKLRAFILFDRNLIFDFIYPVVSSDKTFENLNEKIQKMIESQFSISCHSISLNALKCAIPLEEKTLYEISNKIITKLNDENISHFFNEKYPKIKNIIFKENNAIFIPIIISYNSQYILFSIEEEKGFLTSYEDRIEEIENHTLFIHKKNILEKLKTLQSSLEVETTSKFEKSKTLLFFKDFFWLISQKINTSQNNDSLLKCPLKESFFEDTISCLNF